MHRDAERAWVAFQLKGRLRIGDTVHRSEQVLDRKPQVSLARLVFEKQMFELDRGAAMRKLQRDSHSDQAEKHRREDESEREGLVAKRLPENDDAWVEQRWCEGSLRAVRPMYSFRVVSLARDES